MTTLTIKKGKKFSRTEFEDVDDLRNYLTGLDDESLAFLSEEMNAALEYRLQSLLLGNVKGINLEAVKSKMENRFGQQ